MSALGNTMKFCSDCAEPVSKKIPSGDTVARYVCASCDTIHYQNPRMVVGVVVAQEDTVLLCRRAIEPRKGFWTLPAGFMENGETSLSGALRETWEEARAEVDTPQLYRMFELPYINQVYILYRGLLRAGNYAAGPESLEVELFKEADIPWQELAFPIVTDTLKEYFEDRKTGVFPVRISEVEPHWQRHKAALSTEAKPA